MIYIKRTFAAAFAVLSIFSGSHIVRGDERPLFDRNEYQLGNMSEGHVHQFQVRLKNSSGESLNILSVEPTCVYVEAEIDRKTLAKDETAVVTIRIDARHNLGRIAKTIEVRTDRSSDPHILTIRGTITHPEYDRNNLKAVFEGECGKCHVGKNVQALQGKQLYDALCYACHKGTINLKKMTGSQLTRSISNGVPGLMPGFIESSGGPLNTGQIDSLVEFINREQQVK